MEKRDITIKLRNVRLSFPHLFTPRKNTDPKNPDAAPKYEAAFLLHKKDHASVIAEIKRATQQLIAQKKWAPATVKGTPLAEAESKVNAQTNEPYDGYDADHVYVSARSKGRPLVVDKLNNTVTEEDGIIYAGCYVNANVDIYAYDKVAAHGRRVCASLRAIQFCRDGEPFGSSTRDANEEFGDVAPEGEESFT